jgi:hypothetical protein
LAPEPKYAELVQDSSEQAQAPELLTVMPALVQVQLPAQDGWKRFQLIFRPDHLDRVELPASSLQEDWW